MIVKNIHTFDVKNAGDFIEWYEKIRISLNIYDKAAFRGPQGEPLPSAASDTDGSKLAAWNTVNEDLCDVLFVTTKGAICSVVRRLAGKILDEGSGHGQRVWAALHEKFDGCSREALRAGHAKMNSARRSPGQDPDEFLYEFDTRRERINACDPPEGPTDCPFEDIILQALSPEYECIRTLHLEKPNFGIADVRRMMPAIYAANFARSSSTTRIAGHRAAIPAAEDNRRDTICHYCERAGHFKNTYPLHAKHEQQRQQREQRNKQKNQQQQGRRRQRGRQRRGKTSRQPSSNGGRWCSYHNTTNHSDADCRAIKNANGNAHVAAAQHTRMQGICSARDIPDPKEDSERPFISFSATEVTSSAATTTSKQEKNTWPFGPSPATCPWPLAEYEKPFIDFGSSPNTTDIHILHRRRRGAGLRYGLNVITSARRLQQRQ